VVERNISALLAHRTQSEGRRSAQQRIADAVGRFVGSMASVYLHLLVFGAWIVVNLGWTPLPRFDRSFVVLAMAASVEAIFLSTFVLIMQNRLAALSEQRAELDLQISLLAEHEITRVLQVVGAIADKLGVAPPEDPEFEELKKDVAPETVLERLDAAERDARQR
jgi:uncharacterized membrane protein